MTTDPYSLVAIDGTQGPIYLPRNFVQHTQEALAKSRKASAGRIFSDYNTVSAVGPGTEKPRDGLPFDMLRQLADTSPIDNIIINTRVMQMKRVARRAVTRDGLGFAVRHVRHADPDFEVPEGLKILCRDIERIINAPTAPYHATARDFFACAVEEELTIDRKAMVILRDNRGLPVKFHLLDGATILPIQVVLFEAMQKQYASSGQAKFPDLQQTLKYLYDQSGFDLSDAAYVQMIDAKIVGSWRADEMSIDITNPSVRLNQWGYGKSLLEKSWRLSEDILRGWNYNRDLIDVKYPESVVGVNGDYDPEGLKSFKRVILGDGDGRQNSQRLVLIPLGDDKDAKLQMFKLRDSPKDMLFDKYLDAMICLKAAAYRIHPSMINWSRDSSGSITIGPAADKETEIEQSLEEGFHMLLDSQADWLSRSIVQEYHEDLVCTWVGLNRESEDARVDRLVKEAAWLTTNERRKRQNLAPLKGGIPKNPADMPGDYQAAVGIVQGQQQQDQQGGYGKGDFGQPGQGTKQPPQLTQGQQTPPNNGAPSAPAPQRGGPQHPEEEAQQLRRSLTRPMRQLRIHIADDDDEL